MHKEDLFGENLHRSGKG